MRSKSYGPDPLATPRPRRDLPRVEAEPGMVVEDAASGFCGAVVDIDRTAMTLEDRHGRRRVFPYSAPGLLLEGRPVRIARPTTPSPVRPARTASGSVATPRERARVARASRIYVEGLHDCELVEAIWGDDLRHEGVVVEQIDGVDHLPEAVRAFDPGPDARLGVLLDHVVTGSKESRIAAGIRNPYVLVVGHPFVDIWQAVKPARLGLGGWPEVARDRPWKETVAAHLGEPDVATAWRRIRRSVRDYTDLEPALLRAVEALIDFVTAAEPLPA